MRDLLVKKWLNCGRNLQFKDANDLRKEAEYFICHGQTKVDEVEDDAARIWARFKVKSLIYIALRGGYRGLL